MEKTVILRSMYRALCYRSHSIAAVAQSLLRHHHYSARSIFSSSSPHPSVSNSSQRASAGLGSVRFFSEDVAHLPAMKNPELRRVFKDLLAASWNEIPESVIHDVKEALSKNNDDQVGKEAVENVFRAAEAVEEFGGMVMSLKMEMDDSTGVSGEDVKPLPDELKNALKIFHDRYTTYLDAFGPDEGYLRKKVETELGAKMIYLKMRCSGLGAEWGKVTVLGTTGLAGSFVEHRA